MARDPAGTVSQPLPNQLWPEQGNAAARIKSPCLRLESIFDEGSFKSLLVRERYRAQRSGRPFVLMLLETTNPTDTTLSREILDVLPRVVRETDVIGWYKEGAISGIIFTEVTSNGKGPVPENLRVKILAALEEHLGKKKTGTVTISTYLYPEGGDGRHTGSIANSRLYPEIQSPPRRKQIFSIVKRAIDVVCSVAILLLLSPVLALIALVIKLTSKGPVLFRQERLGLHGACFTCLKFRTMYIGCDSKIHEEYVQQFIAGKADPSGQCGSAPVYKIKEDPRVTRIGRFLRKTSLDEFPQFWNVLKGEMSMVGPRPALPYEFKAYDLWHRRRVLEVKPGITGLWQVSGRSRLRFEEMVRLDLHYHQRWSLWLDLRILAATPSAVCSGEGAY